MVGVAVIVLTNHNIRKEKTALSYEVEVQTRLIASTLWMPRALAE